MTPTAKTGVGKLRAGNRASWASPLMVLLGLACSEASLRDSGRGAFQDPSAAPNDGSPDPALTLPGGDADDDGVPAGGEVPGATNEAPESVLPLDPDPGTVVPVDPGPIPSGPPSEPNTLRAVAERAGRLVGVALNGRRLGTEGELAGREFNYVTAENEMKWNALQPAQGQFNFQRADEIMAVAERHGMQVKGHTLVWYRQLPRWVSSLASADAVRQAMLNHIETVVTRYRGRVRAWDVVNEAWDDAGTEMRNLVFRTYLGDSYIDEAFHAARAADPDAKLYYNDFGAEGTSTKANNVYEMVRGMVERGVPIDGVGLQLHVWSVDAGPSRAEFERNMQRIADLGLSVVISELDVSSCGEGTLEERLENQRDRFYNLTAACVAQPACEAISVWGLSDAFSWLNGMPQNANCSEGQEPLGLMFDGSYQKKPAYYGVFDALSGL